MGINNKQFLLNQIIWIGTISSVICSDSRSLRFAQYLYSKDNDQKDERRKRCRSKGRGVFGPGLGSDKLKYYCMNCGAQHTQAVCPKCGSKMWILDSSWIIAHERILRWS